MSERINTTIVLTAEHLANCEGYYSNNNCILATALKEKFPTATKIDVGGWGATVYFENPANTKVFCMEDSDATAIVKSYYVDAKFPIEIALYED